MITYTISSPSSGELKCEELTKSKTNQNKTRAGVNETLCPQHMLASKDNLETREIIQSNIYRNLPKVNQFIYTVDTICVPNIMTLAQMVLLIFY